MRSHVERGRVRRRDPSVAGANGARSSRRGQRVVDSDVTTSASPSGGGLLLDVLALRSSSWPLLATTSSRLSSR